jgi:L-lactate dehydrogenase
LPQRQVFGSGTFLDSNRLRAKIATALKVSETAVHAYALGEHGDSQFVAWSSARVGGVPLTSFKELDQKTLNEFAESAKQKAYDIINKKGSKYRESVLTF